MFPLIRILLIEDNRIEARLTQQRLATVKDGAFEVETVDQLQLGTERLARPGIDIVLLDLNLPDSRGMDTFIRLHEQFPNVPVVVLTGEYDEQLGPLAVEKGAQDYLIKQQADANSLVRVLRFALARHRAQAELLSQSSRVKAAKVLGFVGAKGGVGTTTVALNVAASLAARKKSVVIVELQPGSGSLAHHLRQVPVDNLSNLLKLPADRIDERSLAAALGRGPANLGVLFAPQGKDPFQVIEPEQAVAIVRGLARLTDFVILDLPHTPTAATQATFPLCHFTALITEREPGSVASGKEVIQRLHDWRVPSHMVGAVIVNRTIYPLSMEMSKVQSQLGCDLIGSILSDTTACLNAQESGLPIVLASPQHEISLNLVDIADRLAAKNVAALSI
jgi:Flp pilus assembly CpaE family ATPase